MERSIFLKSRGQAAPPFQDTVDKLVVIESADERASSALLQSVLNRDVILILSDYLDAYDIYNLGGICVIARRKLRQDSSVWKVLVCRQYPSKLWAQLDLADDAYQQMAIEFGQRSSRRVREIWNPKTEQYEEVIKEIEEIKSGELNEPDKLTKKENYRLQKHLHELYVVHKLSLPMSNPNAMRAYIEITTDKLSAPHNRVILEGKIVVFDNRLKDDDGTFVGKASMEHRLVFKRLDGKSFLYFKGEESHDGIKIRSEYKPYLVNRANRGPQNIKDDLFDHSFIHVKRTETNLSQNDNQLVAQLLKLDLVKEVDPSLKKSGDGIVAQGVVGVDARRIEMQRLLGMLRGRMVQPAYEVECYTDWVVQVDFEVWFQLLHEFK